MSEYPETFPSSLTTQSKKPCPFCGEEIQAEAKKCRYCGEWLNENPQVQQAASIGRNSSVAKPVVRPAPITKRRINWWAAIGGGFLAGFFEYLLLSLLFGEPQMWIFWVGWLVSGFIFSRRSWSTVWGTLSVMSFCWPLFTFFGGMAASSDYTTEAEMTGAAIGSVLGAGLIGILGFFFGITFALLAYFTKPKN